MKKRVVIFATIALCAALLTAQPASAASSPYIVVLKSSSDVTKAVNKAKSLGAAVSLTYRSALRGYAANIPADKVSRIAADPAVSYVTADKSFTWPTRPLDCVSLASCQELPRGLDRIDADVSSTKAGNGNGSVNANIAIVDSGVAPHTDLNVVGGKSCINNATFDDQNGHGTHVAGTAAARDNGFGVVGAAPGARIWAVRVLGKNGTGNDSRVLCGIDWVASTRTDSDPSNDIHVANMSLGQKGSDDGACGTLNKDPIHTAICAATGKGVFFVVAAGNSGIDLAQAVPASYDEVLTVTSMTDWDRIPGGFGEPADAGTVCANSFGPAFPDFPDDAGTIFSNYAVNATDAAHTIAAPGVCVLSTWRDNVYAWTSGTSMATPHVSGVAALCIATGSCAGLSSPQMIQKLRNDAAAFTADTPAYGFTGDLVHPYSDGRIFGPLVRAALY